MNDSWLKSKDRKEILEEMGFKNDKENLVFRYSEEIYVPYVCITFHYEDVWDDEILNLKQRIREKTIKDILK
tara:strand:- start:34119 stop:34334 length:216 start_codon:yes stop_codon:yes gene_type:complete